VGTKITGHLFIARGQLISIFSVVATCISPVPWVAAIDRFNCTCISISDIDTDSMYCNLTESTGRDRV